MLGGTKSNCATLALTWFVFAGGCGPKPATQPSTPPTSTSMESAEQSVAEPAAPEPDPGSESDLQARGVTRKADTAADQPALSDRWLTMSLLTRDADRQWHVVEPGGSLRSGETMQVEVELQRPAFLYLINDTASGATVLYPDPNLGDQDVKLGKGVHPLPPVTSELPLLELDDQTGVEYLVVIASDRKLTEADPELAKYLGEVRSTGEHVAQADFELPEHRGLAAGQAKPAVKVAKRKRPRRKSALDKAEKSMGPKLRERGVRRVREAGRAIDASAGEDGVAVIPFRFDHIDDGNQA